ncbi:MAG: right-handed parallel beta-helix repeat-containing protein, partial [Chitinivibrionales bacterium]|nr:right-handed parallel beta-helix repeat-containing protein [Chitinivibrionales bacterium]
MRFGTYGVFLLLFSFYEFQVLATTYYIDFNDGNDNAAATSEMTPWKHCPGDSNATAAAAQCVLKPGDRVLFKGGVKYRGKIQIRCSGTAAAPIVFKGDGWGVSKAIIDGSEPVTALWTRCESQEEAEGNPQWQNIWYASLPLFYNAFSLNLIEENEFLHIAQYPSPSDPFYYDNPTEYMQPDDITRTSVEHSQLASLGGSNLVGCYVFAYLINDYVVEQKIDEFDEASNTVIFADLGVEPNTGDKARYALANSVCFIDAPGEFSYSEDANGDGGHTTYLWPRGGNPNTRQITYSVRNFGIDLSKANDVVIEGFAVQRTVGWLPAQDGIAIGTYADFPASNIQIRNNTIAMNRHASHDGYGGIFLQNVSNACVENNTVTYSPNMRGIFCIQSKNCIIRNNTILQVGNTGVSNYTCSMMQITGNTIDKCLSTHANGISLYAGCKDILVAKNRIFSGTVTLESASDNQTENITIFGNIIDAEKKLEMILANWCELYGKIMVLNNTIIGTTKSQSVMLDKSTVHTVMNNILDGATIVGQRSKNVYVGLMWTQVQPDTWDKGGDYVLYDEKTKSYTPYELSKLLPGVNGRNYIPKMNILDEANTIITDSGVDITGLLPVDKFPGYDFSTDIMGTKWPLGKNR